jgi:DNA-binding transcriptional LysR family regulator
MTIRHLLIFREVALLGNMSAAASRLYLSQPTVSQAIRELELHYEARLFERFPKKLVITPIGAKLLRYAEAVLKEFDQMEREMSHSAEEVPLRIGASVTVGTCVLGALIKQYEQSGSPVKNRVSVWVNNTASVEEKLLNGTLDLGIVEGKIKSTELVCRPILEDRLVLVCGNTHPFAGKQEVSVQELSGQDFILREKGSGTRELFLHDMERLGIEIHPKWICNNAGAIKQAVIEGQGLSVISFRLVEKEIREGRIFLLHQKECSWKRMFQLVYHKKKFISHQMRLLIDLVEKSLQKPECYGKKDSFTEN